MSLIFRRLSRCGFAAGLNGYALSLALHGDLMYITTRDGERVYMPVGIAVEEEVASLVVLWFSISVVFRKKEQ